MIFNSIDELKDVIIESMERDRDKIKNLRLFFNEKMINKLDESFEEIDFLIETKEHRNIIKHIIGLY